MSCNFLIDQALKLVWAGPRQDTQSIVKPKRITPDFGVFNTFHALHDKYILPSKGIRYHVYQIGQLYPLLMGLFPRQDTWISLLDNCNMQNMIVNLYSTKGIELPRYSSYYLVTPDRNLLIAIQEQPNVDIDLNTEDLYIRVYTNSYFQGLRYKNETDFIKVVGRTITNQTDIINLKEEYEKYRELNLNTPLLYINGRKTNLLNLNTAKLNDTVEFIVDTSIKRYVEFKISNLRTFDSIKDLKRKYLLHYSTPFSNSEQLDYHDDLDFYIIKKDPKKKSPLYTGFYYHRNQQDAVRNITHRDYSITVPYVTRYTEQDIPLYKEDNPAVEWYIQVYIRKGGWDRQLQFVHDRIKELYKLPDKYIVKSFLGIDSVVDEWRADNLENSDYMAVVSNSDYNLDAIQVENMFGYNAVSKYIADTPSKVEIHHHQKVVPLPLILRKYSTGFEYDKLGKYLGYRNHVNANNYVAFDSNTELVEVIGGYGSEYIDEQYTQPYTHYDEEFDYRVYRKEKNPVDGITKWYDVTNKGYYILNKEKKYFEQLENTDEYDYIIRSNKNILIQEVKDGVADGIIYFPFSYLTSRSGIVERAKLEIPLGELDVILNGYSLVEGIDYIVDFPNIAIINKRFLSNLGTEKQHIVVRSYGFPYVNDDGYTYTRQPKEDIGFVKYGVLSRNSRFDIRDDRVLRINVGGRVIHRDDLSYSEHDTGIRVEGIENGYPYEIKDILVPFRSIVSQDEFLYRKRSQDMDVKISNYLSQFIKDPVFPHPSAIPSRWEVYSPFFSKVMFDLKSGVLDNKPIRQQYNDNFVLEHTERYNYLLRVDPTQDDTLYNDDYVIVHPHPFTTVIDVDPWQYRFLEKVVDNILHNRVDMSSFIRIVG